VVEKATRLKPALDTTNIEEYAQSDYAEQMDSYEEYLRHRPKYPFPALPADCPDELVEGRDFRLGMQRFIDGLDKWVDCEKIEYDSISWQLHQSHRRIIAVPLSVKSGEEKTDMDLMKKAMHLGLEFSKREAIKNSGEGYKMGAGFGYSCGLFFDLFY